VLHAVIMAGGVGSRFWPLSRAKSPKQLLRFFDEQSMIQKTVTRLEPLIPSERVVVVTNAAQADEIRRQLPRVPPENILVEPVGRNTAPCIGLAAVHILRRDPEAVMAVLAADHLIEPADEFCRAIDFGARLALESNVLVTMGIPPTRPETGYGYIQFITQAPMREGALEAYRVKTFAEKPNPATALRFLQSGDFLWNSGMFVWRTATILSLMDEFLPEMHQGLKEIADAVGTRAYESELDRVYRTFKSVSIDYGVMEHARDVIVIRAPFTWNDVGSWEEVYQLTEKDGHANGVRGETILHDVERSLIFSPKKLVAAVGISDVIVVETEDALLVCRRDRAQDVKKIVDELTSRGHSELL
jgi:mannose-1-phosphate guanylyltransferase